MASRESSIPGSETVSQRISSLPCQTKARMRVVSSLPGHLAQTRSQWPGAGGSSASGRYRLNAQAAIAFPAIPPERSRFRYAFARAAAMDGVDCGDVGQAEPRRPGALQREVQVLPVQRDAEAGIEPAIRRP